MRTIDVKDQMRAKSSKLSLKFPSIDESLYQSVATTFEPYNKIDTQASNRGLGGNSKLKEM